MVFSKLFAVAVACLCLLKASTVAAEDCTIRLTAIDAPNRIFQVTGPLGERCVIEWSTNLRDWSLQETNDLSGCDGAPARFTTDPTSSLVFVRARRYEPPEACGTALCFSEQATNLLRCPRYGPADDPANRDASIPTPATPVKLVRLMVHVLAEDNGANPAVTPEKIEAQLSDLNRHFRPARIQFAHDWRVVNASRFRRLGTVNEVAAMKQAFSLDPASQHNVFVTDTRDLFLGQSTFPWITNTAGDFDTLTARGGSVVSARRFNTNEVTLTHELGHAFGLWHTHHGIEVQPPCSVCWEPATGAAGDSTGDRCSDTPPTPLDVNCQLLGLTDSCAKASWPLTGVENFMSAAPWCHGRFTPQQAGRMHCWITNRLAGWLDSVTPATPSDLAVTVTVFNEVTLTWLDNASNETGYDVERRGPDGVWILLATLPANSTSFFDPAPPASTVLAYRVHARNGSRESAATMGTIVTPPTPGLYYVDAANLDGMPPFGATGNPFPILGDAVRAVSGPSRIFIVPGQYRELRLESGAPARLESRGGPVLVQP